MQLRLKTDLLKGLIVKSIKGVGNNKLIPITELMGIKVIDGELTLITTDATNYLYVKEVVGGSEFNVTVDANKFSKLISKLTCETVLLTVTDNELEVVGNGTYKIELPLDENGNLIDYPNPLQSVDFASFEEKQIDLSTVQIILNSVRPSLSNVLTVPCYTGYYVGDKIVATDTYKVASLSQKLVDTPILISSATLDLLSVMDREHITFSIKDEIIIFNSDNCAIYGRLMVGVEDFQIKAIDNLLNSDFDGVVKVSKYELLQVLDRLSLFVNVYDKNSITLNFTKDGLELSSNNQSGVELIEYVEQPSYKEFMCLINVELFATQIKAQTGDIVEICYGRDNAIKLIDNNLVYIVALLEETK